MQNFNEAVKQFIQNEEGLTTVEYAIAGALVAAAVVLSFTNLGTAVGARIDALTGVVNPAAGG